MPSYLQLAWTAMFVLSDFCSFTHAYRRSLIAGNEAVQIDMHALTSKPQTGQTDVNHTLGSKFDTPNKTQSPAIFGSSRASSLVNETADGNLQKPPAAISRTSSAVFNPCEDLDGCEQIRKLLGGNIAQVFLIKYGERLRVAKIGDSSDMRSEASNLERLSETEWGQSLAPVLYERTNFAGGRKPKERLIMEYLSPEGDCPWSPFGKVLGVDPEGFKVENAMFDREEFKIIWSKLLSTLIILKNKNWHHGDLHPYNMFINMCTKEFKLIDWETGKQGKTAKVKIGDVMKLTTSFGSFYAKIGTHVTGQITSFIARGKGIAEHLSESEPWIMETFEEFKKVFANGRKTYIDTPPAEHKALLRMLNIAEKG